MSMPRSSMLATLLVCGIFTIALGAEGPKLGKDISQQDLAEWDINIQPTGAGLPPGSGTAAQGAKIYLPKCAGCHGLKGEGGLAPTLIGNHPIKGIDEATIVLAGYWPFASTLFDYIRRAMPWQSPRSLSDDEVYALCAFILAGNGLIPQDQVIDASNLAQVKMPNRNGFIVRFPTLTPAFSAP
jgi:S-disulfanyl-L-cysteine oxidoreductase SoxD